jgi:anti-sigma factor RsiW
MNCPMESGENAEYLLGYASGELNPTMHAQIEQHLSACPGCREFAAKQRTVWQALDSWEPAEVSMDFDRRLYQRIEQQVTWWTRLTRPFNPLFRHGVPIAAAAGLVMVAGFLMNRPATVPVVTPSQESAVVEALQPEQVETALEDMETLREFSHLVRPDGAEPKM